MVNFRKLTPNLSSPYITIITHGSSMGIDSDFIIQIEKHLQQCNFNTYAFDFSYLNNTKPSPDQSQEVTDLHHAIKELSKTFSHFHLIGKSLGAIVELLYTQQFPQYIESISILGFPIKLGIPIDFRLLKQTDPTPLDYEAQYQKVFAQLNIPVQIIQGDHDELADLEVINNLSKKHHYSLTIIPESDHGFRPTTSTKSTKKNYQLAAKTLTNWLSKFEGK